MLAPPISYAIDGTQYVAILAGTGGIENFVGTTNETAALKYGNFGKLLVFKLGGDAVLKEPRIRDRSIPEQPLLTASAEQLLRVNNSTMWFAVAVMGLTHAQRASFPICA